MRTVQKTSSYREPLILIGFVILGALLGILMGERAAFLYPIGQMWLNLLFVLLVPLIFFSISSSIATVTDTKRVGKLLTLTILIFAVTAAIAGIYMFTVTGIFGVDTSIQMGEAVLEESAASSSVGEQIVNTFTVGDFPLVISRSHILALIVFTVFFGITVSLLGEKGRPVAEWLSNLSLVFYKMVELLMKLAPIGLMAYFANLTGTYGPELLASYARGLLIYYPAAFFSALPEGCLNSVDRVESNVECPYIFNVCGYSIPIQDDRLASALLEFDDMERGILLLSYSIKLSDRAVGELLKLSRSRVWRMKSKLLSALREKMKE